MCEAMIFVNVPAGQISLPADTVYKLEQWGRWVCPQTGCCGRCASAEGKYDSRYPDERRGILASEIDLQVVIAVERVICTKLPRRAKEIIKRKFAWREKDTDIIRFLGIFRPKYGHELRRAVLMVRNNLTGLKYHV
jgi:hypothetical protein